jgi:dolichyldiphosphatase
MYDATLLARCALSIIWGADDDSSYFSLALALVTLSPILLMVRTRCFYPCHPPLSSAYQPAYAALALQTREYTIIMMWAGQFAGEVLNIVLKRAVKQGRPACGSTIRKCLPVNLQMAR